MVAGGENAKQVENRAARELAPLSGRTAFLFAELTPEGPRPLFALRADEKFAIAPSPPGKRHAFAGQSDRPAQQRAGRLAHALARGQTAAVGEVMRRDAPTRTVVRLE
jgi:hypothetical protein